MATLWNAVPRQVRIWSAPLRDRLRRFACMFEDGVGQFTVSQTLQLINYMLILLGGVLILAVWWWWFGKDADNKKAQFLVAVGSILFGMMTVLSLIQMVWLRKRIEFSTYSKEMFLSELYKVVASVKSGAAERPQFFYLCSVHDPCLPELSGQSVCSMFLTEFRRVLDDPAVLKHVAIATPELDLFSDNGVALDAATADRLRSEGRLLNVEEHYLRWNTRLSNKDDPKFAFESWRKTARHTTFRDIITPNETADRTADENGAYDCYKESVALFRELFLRDRVVCAPQDPRADLILYGMPYPKLESTECPRQNFSINLFCSDTRGLLIFFDFYAYPYYTIEAMPLHNARFLTELVALFRGKVNGAIRIDLAKADPPQALARPAAGHASASVGPAAAGAGASGP